MNDGIPEGWTLHKMDDVAEIIMGQSPSSETYNTERNGLPFFQGKADFGSKYPKIRYWCSIPTKVAPANSILFSVRAPVGDINITRHECCIGRGLSAIIGRAIAQPFLYQILKHAKPQFQLISQGSTFEAVNGSDLKEFRITIPPLPEQKKIAAILTSVDEVIEKTEAQINKLQDLKKAMMQSLLTQGIGHTEFKDSPVGRIPKEWEVITLSKLCNQITDGTHKTPDYTTSGIPFLRVTDLKNKDIFRGDIKYISRNEHLELIKRCNPRKGDILYSKNGTVGIPRIVDWSKEFSIFVSLALLKVNAERVSSGFLEKVLDSPLIHSQIKLRSKQGTVTNLHLEEIREFLIPIPSKIEQEKITCILTSVDTNIESNKAKLTRTQNLKKSLMQDLLTGKVRVKVD